MKKRVKFILILLGIIMGILLMDIMQAKIFNHEPFLKVTKNYNGGTLYKQDKGILTDTYTCTNGTKKTVFKWEKYNCVDNNIKKVVDIADNSKYIDDFTCDEALEPFYEDEKYVYSYSCIKSSYVVVKYQDRTEETVKESLKKGRITIKDLDRFDIKYIKEEKNNKFTTIMVDSKEMNIRQSQYNLLKVILNNLDYKYKTCLGPIHYTIDIDGKKYMFYGHHNMVGYDNKCADIDGDDLTNLSSILDFVYSDNDMNNIPNVSMIIKDGTLTRTGATVIITDTNDNPFDYGFPFRLDIMENGTWKKVEVTGDGAFELPAFTVDENKRLELNQNWGHIYGKLENGEYRLVKSVCVNDGCSKSKYFSTEFIIE